MKPGARAGYWLLAGLGAVLITAGLTWLLQNFELRSKEMDAGYSAAARRNPLLAAERILARLHIPVQSVSGRDLVRDLPPPTDTLVVNTLGVLNPERSAALHQWIERGGRLVVEASELWEEPDPTGAAGDGFLDRYGVRLHRLAAPVPDDEVIATVDFDGYPYALQIGLATRYFLEDGSEEAIDGIVAGGYLRLVQYQIGGGLLTVTNDNRPFTNAHIGHHDNALFLSLLARPPGEGKVWLLYDSAMPWLGDLLWRNAPFATVSFLCLTGLLIWHLGGRLGPFLPSPVGDRRDLIAHLHASADFLWRHGQEARVAMVTRERVEQAWLRHHPALRGLDRVERADWIGRRAGIAPQEVLQTLYPNTSKGNDLVTETVLLQHLWARLSDAAGPREPQASA